MNTSLPYDYDPGRLKAVKPCCARVVTSVSLGTGFSIGNSKLLTCNHVMEGKVNTATCHFGDDGEGAQFVVDSRDPMADLCILKPAKTDPPPQFQSARIAAPSENQRTWWGWGFPAIVGGQGVPLFGMVLDPHCMYKGTRIIQLHAENLVGDDAELGGFSGAPVLSGDEVVAVIYRVLRGTQDGQRARFGIIFAVPITAGGAALGGTGGTPPGGSGAPLPPPDPTPTPEESQQLRLFAAIRSASDPRFVLDALNEWERDKSVALPPYVPFIAAEKLIGMGHPRRALEVLDGVEGESPRATQLRGLSLSVLGKHDEARRILSTLPLDAETGGIAAGILKRRYLETGNKAWLECAFEEYQRAYEATRDPYPGVNVAALALWRGDEALSRRVAAEVFQSLEKKPAADRNHWDWASLGEASLLAGNQADALAAYRKAVAGQPSNSRDIAVMRKQLRVTLPMIETRRSDFENLLHIGGVACFSGHRVDDPGRKPARFPRDRAPLVAKEVRATLDERNIRFGFSSAANGGDILFLEQLIDRGGEAEVFLPFPAKDFVETSVGVDWQPRFDAVMKKGNRVHVLLDHKPETREAEDAAYANCNRVMMNAALEAGRIYDEKPMLIAALSTAEAKSPGLVGGTVEVARTWKDQLRDVVQIDPIKLKAKRDRQELG